MILCHKTSNEAMGPLLCPGVETY